jgi:NhaA family Na+:H+ antiporter
VNRARAALAAAFPPAGPPLADRRWWFGPISRAEARRLADALRGEAVGGMLLLAAAVVALAWANSPWSGAYTAVRDTTIGPAAAHLNLPLGAWAADGLLAVFFFVAGLEVKREFLAGDLRDPRRAALPVMAAVGGVVTPLAVYLLVNSVDGGERSGWAVPIATDIAFALAVLAVTGSRLPTALRTFLLTLAVVDDLIAITIIAVFFTADLHLIPLAVAMIPLVLFGFLARRAGARGWAWAGWLLLPLAAATWGLVHASGVHATVAGVLLAFTVPVAHGVIPDPSGLAPSGESAADRLEHRVRPWSAAVAVPVFAFFAAGVSIGGVAGIRSAAGDPVVLGVVAGLLVGKPVGVWGAAWLTARFTHAELDEDLGWFDVAGLALLSGIGFTVSLLIGELAFGPDTLRDDHVKIAVLAASVLAAAGATVVLRLRNRVHRGREVAAGVVDRP